MAEMKKAKARRLRAARRRRQRRQRITIGVVAGLVVIVIIVAFILLRPGAGDESAAPVPTAVDVEPTATAMPTAIPTALPTSTPEPTATPTVEPGLVPDVVSFYQPEGKSYSPRVRMGDEFSAKWKKGEDIGSFEVIASDADRLEGDFFGDIFGGCWKTFPNADQCKIGFTLRYSLSDGSEIQYTMLSPSHVEHTEYIECWLYDDYHREPHKSYSHIKSMKDDTLITSIKLTCGRKIKEVQEIWLTAFICASMDEFDANRNYTGPTACTLHITRA